MQRRVSVELIALVITAAGALLQSTPTHAAPSLSTRCAADSLNPAVARMRLEWARSCGTRINVVSPTSPQPPSSGVPSGTSPAVFVDYFETNDFFGKNSYSGDGSINQVFTQSQWRIGPITLSTDAFGFPKWTEASSLLLFRPVYPTFGNNLDINLSVPLYPNPNYSLLDCKLYTDPAGTTVANTSVTGFYVNGYCSANTLICSDGTVEDIFGSGMVGCAGSTTFASRSALCAPGYKPATAAQWVANRGAAAPTHNYWTDDALKWNGIQSACFVSTTVGNDSCGASPMHVCTALGTDAEGNSCNWTHCGLNASTPDQFFGGCVSNAGTLCMPLQ